MPREGDAVAPLDVVGGRVNCLLQAIFMTAAEYWGLFDLVITVVVLLQVSLDGLKVLDQWN